MCCGYNNLLLSAGVDTNMFFFFDCPILTAVISGALYSPTNKVVILVQSSLVESVIFNWSPLKEIPFQGAPPKDRKGTLGLCTPLVGMV